MKVHVVSAILVGLVGSGLPLGLAEKVTLIFCVLLVFFAEILNSALETLVDLATQEFDEKARVTKDAAAAAVLVLSIGSAVIFAALAGAQLGDGGGQRPAHRAAGAVRAPAGRMRGAADAGPARGRGSRTRWPSPPGSALAGVLATWTTSAVFTAMTAGAAGPGPGGGPGSGAGRGVRATKNPAAT